MRVNIDSKTARHNLTWRMYAPAPDPLLLDVYGCCAAPSRWPNLLEDTSAEFEALCSVIHCVTVEQYRFVPYWTAYSPNFNMSAYRSEISEARDPLLHIRRSVDLDYRSPIVLGDDDLFTSDEASVRGATQGQYRRIGLGSVLMGLAKIDVDRFFTIAMFRSAATDSAFHTAHRQRLDAILPHFAQAMSLAESVSLGRSAATLVHGHLDRWPRALVLCDSSGRVQWVNRRADLALRARDDVHINQGILRLSQAGAHRSCCTRCPRPWPARRPSTLQSNPARDACKLRCSLSRRSTTVGRPSCLSPW